MSPRVSSIHPILPELETEEQPGQVILALGPAQVPELGPGWSARAPELGLGRPARALERALESAPGWLA